MIATGGGIALATTHVFGTVIYLQSPIPNPLFADFSTKSTSTSRQTMAVARPALSVAGCSQCRLLVLNLFTGSVLRSAPLVRPSLCYSRPQVVGALPIRRFSSLPKPNDPASDAEHGQNARVLEEEPESSKDEDEGEAAATELKLANVPWYLQVDPPTHIAPLEPPPLPEVPPDAPPLIGSLLEYASEEMGLDELTLLDLRQLDPPPALGPSLFMLFGTARSERHLTSAPAAWCGGCRKTKLRRKARRAKLLGTMGTDDADDGIRTGWICVNLGTIDRSGTESAVVAEDGRVSGFGVSHVGSTIVFQIMTEGRRAEMALETLWTRALDRSLNPPPESGSIDGSKDSKSRVKPERELDPKSRPEREPAPKSRVKPERELDPVEKAMLANLHRPAGITGGRKGQSTEASPWNRAHFYSTQQISRAATTEVDPLSTSSPEELARVLTYDAHQKQRLLGLLRTRLDEMDAQTAQASLGESNDDSQPTPFMELMELAMETLPPTRTWEYRLAVQYKASVSGVTSALQSLDDVRLLVEELRIYGIKATRYQYLQLLSCVFYANERQANVVVDLALDVIKTMHQRNESIMADDLITAIIEGASKPNNRRRWNKDLMERVEKLLYRPNAPCMDDQLLMRLMTVYAGVGFWDKLWTIWGVPARHLRPRSVDLYIHVFKLAAVSGSINICTRVLRRCIPEAGSEDPPVIGDVRLRRAALECIQVADPRAQELAETLPPDGRGQLRRLATREFGWSCLSSVEFRARTKANDGLPVPEAATPSRTAEGFHRGQPAPKQRARIDWTAEQGDKKRTVVYRTPVPGNQSRPASGFALSAGARKLPRPRNKANDKLFLAHDGREIDGNK
ncbi:hypothetical protein CIB48_g11783 [Xylaria polymorpha]|nr:hypothetical protein CIB48_g11783 [Xylaria polymorpha]